VRAYVLRRLLLMIPTFFGISLLLFAVLNFAPGRPGSSQSQDIAQTLRSADSQESYRIFREQFFLDKPVLLNTRFSLSAESVDRELELASGKTPGTAAERIHAQEALEDYGQYVVPHLMRNLDHADSRVRDVTVYFLRLNAPRPLRDPYNPHPSAEVRTYNREVNAERAELRELKYLPEAPEEKKLEVIAAWKRWYTTHTERFHYDFGDKVRILLFDTRFARYWWNLVRLDFGVSLVSREPVVATLVSKLKYSLTLSVGSLLLAYFIAIPLGIFSAVRKGTRTDSYLTSFLFMLYSLPSFFVATLLLFTFSEGSDVKSLRLFPTGGFQSSDAENLTTLQQLGDIAWHLVLPMVCLTYGSLAALSRYMRSGMLDVIQADFVRTARAKGLAESVVIGKHALRNGLLPILTLLAGLLPSVLGGSVIIEYIFGIPGMGLWVVDSIFQRDYNVIMAVELFSTVLVLFGILLTDLSYALVDPRIRYE
jgi:peptide/nickel transport system permease protein